MGNESSVLSLEKDETNMRSMIVHDLIHIAVFYYINQSGYPWVTIR